MRSSIMTRMSVADADAGSMMRRAGRAYQLPPIVVMVAEHRTINCAAEDARIVVELGGGLRVD